jgi:PAT family beta-lactamase induction signal transducer AmpG
MSTRSHARPGFKAYLQPRVLIMLALGFSSGLPFLLSGNTFGYWLRDEGTSLTAIGFISWVGLAYSFKFLWAPLIDRVKAPLLGGLGQRRSWMLIAQAAIVAGLLAMAMLGTAHGLVLLGACALAVAFSSATQDIVIDAWRIESAENEEELGLLSSALQLGYRVALLVTDALILISAEHVGWSVSYIACGVLMAIGIAATMLAVEPARADAVIKRKAHELPLSSPRGLFDAIVGPFIAFFRTYGWLALLMLAAIVLYRIPDFIMGPMANPYYHDIGLTKGYVGGVRASVGLVAALLGITAGGACALRFGSIRTLIVGGVLQALAISAFALLATGKANVLLFSAVMAGDNFSTSFAGVALVTYMSSLTSLGYTATQYALLSSAYTWAGKLMKGFSGSIVEGLSASHGLMGAYAIFFVGAGAIGIPAIILFIVLAAYQRLEESAAEPAPTG